MSSGSQIQHCCDHDLIWALRAHALSNPGDPSAAAQKHTAPLSEVLPVSRCVDWHEVACICTKEGCLAMGKGVTCSLICDAGLQGCSFVVQTQIPPLSNHREQSVVSIVSEHCYYSTPPRPDARLVSMRVIYAPSSQLGHLSAALKLGRPT